MIGITNEKRALPHHRQGSIDKGGDEYPPEISTKKRSHAYLNDIFMRKQYGKFGFMFIMPVLRFLYNTAIKWWHGACQKDVHAGGNWYGNDTIWRTTLDLNQIILYSTKNGFIDDMVQRKYLSVIDGIIGGDGDGPLHPAPKRCGVLLAGTNPVFTDAAAATIMGFDYKKMPTLINALNSAIFNDKLLTTKDVYTKSNLGDINNQSLASVNLNLKFLPSKGWKEYIELQ